MKINFFYIYLVCISNLLYSVEDSVQNEDGTWSFPKFEEQANIKDRSLYEEAKQDRISFWEKRAEAIDWFQRWNKAIDWNSPYAQWFVGGKLNISYNCLDRHLDHAGDKISLIWCNERGEERILTYNELHEEVCRLANGLKSLGVQKGDVVAIYMPHTPEGIAAMLACARIGAVHSVIFAGTGGNSFVDKVNDSHAKVIIAADATYRRGKEIPLIDMVKVILPRCNSVEKVVVFERTQNPVCIDEEMFVSYAELVKNSSKDCPPEALDSEDMHFILYTSGTTGSPKGIMHTAGGYLVGVHNTFNWVFDYKNSDVYWCTADIGWITGHSFTVYGPMSNGATQVIYEGTFDYPNKSKAWEIIEKYNVTTFYTAPTLVRTFMKWGTEWINTANIESLRLIGSIGEPLNPEAWNWYHENVGKKRCPIVDTWFQTETGALVISPLPGVTKFKPGSIAQPLPGFEVGVLNEKAEKVEHGLLAIMSPFPSMLRGVLNNPKRYYDTYWAKWDNACYYAGDDATLDQDGYFWCRGRADEVLKISGHRLGTAEVENAIVSYSGVSEAAIIGIPDEIKGSKIIAFVVLKESTKEYGTLKEEIREYVGKNLAKYAKPEKIGFIRDLPKTRSGKILRRVIFNLYQGKDPGDTTTLVNPDIIEDLKRCIQLIKEEI